MKNIPNKIHDPYVTFLKKHEIPSREIPFYSKWLRYYLDFCDKYSHTASLSNSLSHFINKLAQKNQTEQQIEQAKNAITLFYKLIESYKSNSSQSIVQSKVTAEKPKYDLTAALDISKN